MTEFLKKTWDIISKIVSLTKQTETNRSDVEQLQLRVEQLALEVRELTLELRHKDEMDVLKRKDLLLELENMILRREQSLPPRKREDISGK